MNDLKNRIQNNWNIMRLLRLGIGVMFGIEAISTHDILVGVVGIFFLVPAIFNIGCCGIGGYNKVQARRADNNQTIDIDFEEIK